MRNSLSLKSRSNRRNVRSKAALLEALEQRTLFSVSLTGLPTTSFVAESGGIYNTNSYLAVSGSVQNSFYQGMGFLEFGSSSAVFPKTYKISDVNNMTISLFNTATDGAYAGHPGNFDIYFAPDDTTAATSIRFNTSDVQGLAGQLGTSAATDLGTSAFTNAAGYTDYSFANLSTAVKQGIVNDLNNGTPIRLVVVPDSSTFAADWEGNFSKNQPILSINAEQAATVVENFNLNSPTYSVNEAAGTATITVTRDGSTADTASVHYGSSDGTAIAGTNYTPVSGTLNFAIGQSSASFTVPITDVINQGGNKAFSITLSNPSTAGVGYAHDLGTQTTALVSIIDSNNTASNTENLTQTSTANSTIEVGGPYSTTYFNVTGTDGRYPAFGALDFGNSFGPSKPVTAINSITLNVTQGYPAQGASGPMAVYLVSDSSSDISADGGSTLVFDTTSTPEGLGDQLGTKSLLGNFTWDASSPTDVYTSITLANYDAATESELINDLNTGTKFRIVVVPENSSVAGSFEGSYTYNGVSEAPQISFNVTEAAASQLPSWVAPSSSATWDAGSHTLTVTGPTTITADPGTDAPIITASSSAAKITVNSVAGNTVHFGGLNLTNGASMVVASLGSSRTHVNHTLLVIGATNAVSAPMFNVDSTSTLNLNDNDMVIHNGSLASVQTAAATGRNVTPGGVLDGQWNGTGLTSAVAASADAAAGYEQTGLAVVRNGDLPLGAFSNFDGESVGSNDIIVKYTYTGDLTLSGAVDDNAATVFGFYYNGGASSNNNWAFGDINGDGKVDDTDATAFGFVFGNGVTNGALL